MRKCITCKKRRPRSDFDGLARRCEECWERVAGGPCEECGEPVPIRKSETHRRLYCDNPVCLAAAHSKAGRAKAKRLAARKTKRCPVCRKTKPLTAEHWHRGGRGGLQGYCRPCANADGVARYRTNERRRRLARERAAEQRRRIRERRAADPEFDREYRQLQIAYNRAAQERAKARERGEQPVRQDGPVDDERGGLLPVAPLFGVVDAYIRRAQMHLVMHDVEAWEGVSTDALCENLGLDARYFTAWRSGERHLVQLDVADRVIQRLGVNWFDVYDEERFPEAHARAEALFG
jgi:hypothetical protein